MGTDNSVKSLTDLLESSFWTEWSDDEGIGSDVSLDHSDQSSSDGASNAQESPDNDKKFVKTPRRNISVKKIVKILRRSVGTNETHLSDIGPTVSEFQHQKVFGVDLTEHLEQTSTVVPKILEFCCEVIEQNGVTDGVYRLSGQSSHIVTLKREFEGGKVPDKDHKNDVHAVASLLKVMYLGGYLKLENAFVNDSQSAKVFLMSMTINVSLINYFCLQLRNLRWEILSKSILFLC